MQEMVIHMDYIIYVFNFIIYIVLSAAYSSSKQDRTFLQAPKKKKNERQDVQFTDFQKQLTRRTRFLFHIKLEDD